MPDIHHFRAGRGPLDVLEWSLTQGLLSAAVPVLSYIVSWDLEAIWWLYREGVRFLLIGSFVAVAGGHWKVFEFILDHGCSYAQDLEKKLVQGFSSQKRLISSQWHVIRTRIFIVF
jgi:hypothetical protein